MGIATIRPSVSPVATCMSLHHNPKMIIIPCVTKAARRWRRTG